MGAKRTLSCSFKIKKAAKGTITIEGLANANTVDRMKERIVPSAWQLDNYKKNPIVLFDHGHDPTFGFMPIGKAVIVEAKDEGLYTKIELSSSKTEKISAIRDLVEEGILKTFSVGFDPKSTAKADDDPDGIEITKAELIETSIVPIPMNQDSTFTMLHRRKAYWQTPLAKRWYDVFMDRVELHKRKAWVAAAVHQRLHDLIEVGEIRSRDAALKFVAEEARCTLAQVKNVLSGKTLPVPTPIIKAFAGVLRVESKTLEALNQGDVALLERVMARDDQQEETDVAKKKAKGKKPAAGGKAKKPPKAKGADGGDDAGNDDEAKDGEKAMGKICCIAVSKESAADATEAASKVEAAGYAVDQMEETESAFMFWQVPKDEAGDMSNGLEVPIGDGVTATVIPAEGKAYTGDEAAAEEDDEEKAEGDEETDEEAGDEDEGEETDETPQGIVAAALAALEAGNADEVKLLLEKLAALGEGDDFSKSFKNVDGTDDNPYLKGMEAQNATLGAILNELKGMGEGLKGLADLSVALAKVAGDAKGDDGEDDDEGKDGDLSKSLDSLREYQRDLDKKLKRLNV